MIGEDVKLGDVLRDTITGFTGVAVAKTEWLNGCWRVSLQPKELREGKPIDHIGFDVEQLELVETAPIRSGPVFRRADFETLQHGAASPHGWVKAEHNERSNDMRAVFAVSGDGNGQAPVSGYEIRIGFNGVPGKVALEVAKIISHGSVILEIDGREIGRAVAGDDPVTEERRRTETVCRTVIDASYARAIASAMLSAATESR